LRFPHANRDHQLLTSSTSCRTTPAISASAPPARGSASAVLLCHHYQRADVYRYADLTGDSLKLSRLAAQTDAEYIVFCGVHFMAEVADIMSKPNRSPSCPTSRPAARWPTWPTWPRSNAAGANSPKC
jgi:quinolinate synthase